MVPVSMHEKYMQRCLQLAEKALGNTSPNPLVGCVIVLNDIIIGEGYHKKCGEAHAEVNAINSVTDHELLKKATLYVNLEPCSHFGKTPPCADLIIEKKIPRVIIAGKDTHEKVAGAGIKKLTDAGCEVTVGILEENAKKLNKRFFTFHEKKRPYVILKWAQTADGFIDQLRNSNTANVTWITNDICKKLVHKWRTEEDAFMIGTNTAIKDNPQLTSREWTGKNPVRIVLDRNLRIPPDYNVFNSEAKTLVFTEKHQKNLSDTEFISVSFEQNLIQNILSELHSRSIQSIVIEGGTQLLQSFINEGIWDEARIFTNTELFFKEGITGPKINGKVACKEIYDKVNLVFLKKERF